MGCQLNKGKTNIKSQRLDYATALLALTLCYLLTASVSHAEMSPWELPESISSGAPTPDVPLEGVQFCDSDSNAVQPTLKVYVPPYDDIDAEGNPYWSSKKPALVFFPGLGYHNLTDTYLPLMRNIAQQGTVVFYVEYNIPDGYENAADMVLPMISKVNAYGTHQIIMEGRCAIRWVKQLADRESAAYPIDSEQINAASHSFGTLIAQSLVVGNDELAQRETDEGTVNLLRIVDDQGAPIANPDPLAVSKFFYYLLPSLETYGLPENYAYLDLGSVDEKGVRTIKASTYRALLVGNDENPTGRYGHWEQKWRAKDNDPYYYDSLVQSATLISTGSTVAMASNCAVLNSQAMTPNLQWVTVPMPMDNGSIKCGPYAETQTVEIDAINADVLDSTLPDAGSRFMTGMHRNLMAQYLSDLSQTGKDDILLSANFDAIPAGSQMVTPLHLYYPREFRVKVDTWDVGSYLYMNHSRIPTLFLNGEKDTQTQWFEAASLASQFKQAGFPVEMIRFGEMWHLFNPSSNNDVSPMYLANTVSEFLNMVGSKEIDLDGNGFAHEACTDKSLRDYRVEGTGNNKCLDELSTINRVIIGMPRSMAQMSSQYSSNNPANPYLSCDENNACISNYPLYKGLRYQLDGLAFTNEYEDRGAHLNWKLTQADTDEEVLTANSARSLILNLRSNDIPAGEYELSVTSKDVADVTASITIADHPMNGNTGLTGFNACFKQEGWWIFKWTEVRWKNLSWEQATAREGGWVDLYRDGQLISKYNPSTVFSHNGHRSNPRYELCLSDSSVCSGTIPQCK